MTCFCYGGPDCCMNPDPSKISKEFTFDDQTNVEDSEDWKIWNEETGVDPEYYENHTYEEVSRGH